MMDPEDDFFDAQVAFNPQFEVMVKNASADVFAWEDETFATPLAITDVNGNPLAQLESNQYGVFPRFKVPGHTRVRAKSGTIVTPMLSVYGPATEVQAAVGAEAAAAAAARDAAQTARAQAETARDDALDAAADAAAPTETQMVMAIEQVGPVKDALDSAFARQMVIDANKFGVVADGVTDDWPAWQALVNAAPAGSVLTWTGRSMLRKSIIWKTGVSLVGQGWGRSVLATFDNGVPTWHAAIRWIEGDGASVTNTLDDCTWANFEVDGSQLSTGDQYKIPAKGLFTLYHRRCQWLNLYIHDTQATGLGCDFMSDSLIQGCVVERCGYMNNGNTGGGAGIGIGTGAWEVESVIITGNTTRDNGNWGIFVEVQEYTDAYKNQGIRGTGARIIGNTSVGDRVGIGDRGTVGTLIQGNFIHASEVAGISVSFGAREGAVLDNHVYKSLGVGIFVQTNVSTETVEGNQVYDSATHGIHVQALSAANKNVRVCRNRITRSGNVGILVDSSSGGSTDGVKVDENDVYNNGVAGGGYTQGIRFESNAIGASISRNRVFDDQTTKTQGAGLQLAASSTRALTDSKIEGNNFTGSTLAVSLGAHTRTNVTVQDNLGFRTSNNGVATIADGASSVTVPHGLGGVPTVAQITAGAAATVWVSAKGTTNIVIQRSGTTGALNVDWSATYRP